ncbi:hypothetical protein D1Y84_07195 [Acidipila sp. EB88]|nr:hypothetical protein D1Y84_07195 [Acidipila sp. EB88]
MRREFHTAANDAVCVVTQVMGKMPRRLEMPGDFACDGSRRWNGTLPGGSIVITGKKPHHQIGRDGQI